MKNSIANFLSIILISLILFSCDNSSNEVTEIPYSKNVGDLFVPAREIKAPVNSFDVQFEIIEIDSCEWIVSNLGFRDGTMVHRTKCKYCKHKK